MLASSSWVSILTADKLVFSRIKFNDTLLTKIHRAGVSRIVGYKMYNRLSDQECEPLHTNGQDASANWRERGKEIYTEYINYELCKDLSSKECAEKLDSKAAYQAIEF
jgi:hypothetical protein